MERTSAIIAAAEDAADMRRRLGAAALETDAASDGSGQTRWRATVAARLPSQHWPERTVLITAVDAHTGEPVVFDRHSGVDLVDAVAASCASGFAYSIGGSQYIDGGYRRVLSQAIWSASHLSWPQSAHLSHSIWSAGAAFGRQSGRRRTGAAVRSIAGWTRTDRQLPDRPPWRALIPTRAQEGRSPLPPHPSGRLTGVTASCAARRRFREEADFIPSSAKPPHHHKLLHLEAEFCGDLAKP
jgi:hypothetical protein